MTNDRRMAPGSAADGLALYRTPPAAFRAGIEAAQIEATLAAAPAVALVPLVCAGVLAAGFWSSPQRDLLLHLLALVAAASGLSALALRQAPTRHAPRTVRLVATTLASLVGAAFGTMSLVAIIAADATRIPLTLAALSVALGGVALCGPLAVVGAGLSAPIAFAGAIGFAARGGAEAALAPMILLVVAALGIELKRREQASERAIADHLRAAEQAETMAALLLDQDADADGWVWETDAASRLRGTAPALAASLGRGAATLEGALFKTILVPPAQKGSDGTRAVRRAMADREPFRDLVVEVASPRGIVWWRLSGKPLADAAGAFAGYRGIGADITAARDTEARIAHLANYDSLTGLANREHFHARVGRECEAAVRDGHWRALLYLDLDGFKSVNDSLGHAAGDRVLQEVGRRLKAAAPDGGFDLLLGADVAYGQQALPALFSCASQLLAQTPEAAFLLGGVCEAFPPSVM